MVELVTNSPRIKGSLGCTQENKSLIRLAITKETDLFVCPQDILIKKKKTVVMEKILQNFLCPYFTNVHNKNRMFIPGKSFQPA